jgi:S-adenosyl methyltransferase
MSSTSIRAVDSNVASVARMYDYLLGGKTNLAVDRQVVEAASAAYPGGVEAARANAQASHRFRDRAVRYLAGEAGVQQFLSIGSGLPLSGSIHAVAQQLAPAARVVYVDNDTMVLAHTQFLVQDTPEATTSFVFEDLRNTERVVEQAAEMLDFDEPVAVVLMAMLHSIADEHDPYGSVARLVEAVPSGSYVGLSHMSSEITPETASVISHLNEVLPHPVVDRGRDEIARFLDGLELVEPGIVPVDEWRPDGEAPTVPGGRTPPWYGAVARKP